MKHGTTNAAQVFPWGFFRRKGTRLLCSDGKTRAPAYLAETADTFFSVPAAMRIRGKYITGYMTTDEANHPTDRTKTRKAWTFRAHTDQPGNPLPAWPDDWTSERWELFSAGEETP